MWKIGFEQILIIYIFAIINTLQSSIVFDSIITTIVHWWASYQVRKIAGCACPGMPETFSPPRTSKETRKLAIPACDARAVMHVGIAKPRWWGKRSGHSRRMRNPQFYVSGKSLMPYYVRWSTGAACGITTIINLMIHESVIIVYIIVVTRCITLRNRGYYLLNILIPGLWCRNKHILCLEHLLWNCHLVNVTRLMITNDRKA